MEQFQFLMQVLQTISESQGDPDKVYPLFRENLDQLNVNLAQTLRDWASQILSQVEPEQATTIAVDIAHLGKLIQEFSSDRRADQMEIAIACAEVALEVYPRSTYPKQWAMTQINLVDVLVELFETSQKPQYLDQAFSLFEELVTVNQKIVYPAPLVFYKLGKSLSKQGSYKKAIQTLERTLTLLQEYSLNTVEKLQLMALTLFELARLSHQLLRLDHAKLYFKDALRLFRRLKDEDSAASVMTALGNLELQIGQSEAAQSHLESAFLYYDSQNKLAQKQEVNRLLTLLKNHQKQITMG